MRPLPFADAVCALEDAVREALETRCEGDASREGDAPSAPKTTDVAGTQDAIAQDAIAQDAPVQRPGAQDAPVQRPGAHRRPTDGGKKKATLRAVRDTLRRLEAQTRDLAVPVDDAQRALRMCARVFAPFEENHFMEEPVRAIAFPDHPVRAFVGGSLHADRDQVELRALTEDDAHAVLARYLTHSGPRRSTSPPPTECPHGCYSEPRKAT